MKIVGTKLDNSDYERFEDFCLKEGMTKSETLRDLIKQYCEACEEAEYMEQQEKEKETIESKPIEENVSKEPEKHVSTNIISIDGIPREKFLSGEYRVEMDSKGKFQVVKRNIVDDIISEELIKIMN